MLIVSKFPCRRVEQIQSIRCPNPKWSIAVLENYLDGPACQALRIGRVIDVMGKVHIWWVPARKRISRPYPEGAGFVDINGIYIITGEAEWVFRVMLVMREQTHGWVEAVQSATIGTNPYMPAWVGKDGGDIICAKAVGIARFVVVVGKLSLAFIEFIQAAAECPNPKYTPLVLADWQNGIVAQAGLVARIMLIMDKVVGLEIETVQTLIGANPECFWVVHIET